MKKTRHSETEMMKAVRYLKTTLYKWKSKYSGMDVSQVKRLKELEEENLEPEVRKKTNP